MPHQPPRTTLRLPGSIAVLTLALLVMVGCTRPQSAQASGSSATPSSASSLHATSTAEATSPTVSSPTLTDVQTQSFLVDRYGPSASLHGTWTGRHPRESLTVCADTTVVVAGALRRMLAVCTTLRRVDTAAGGRIDLYALTVRDGKAAAQVASTGLRHGRAGRPGKVAVIRLGRDHHVFEVLASADDSFATIETRTWLDARDADFVEVLRMPARYRHDGRAWCATAEAVNCDLSLTDLTFSLHIDGHAPDAVDYPVAIEVAGIECDQPTTRTVTLARDKNLYRVPDALSAPGCSDVSASSSAPLSAQDSTSP